MASQRYTDLKKLFEDSMPEGGLLTIESGTGSVASRPRRHAVLVASAPPRWISRNLAFMSRLEATFTVKRTISPSKASGVPAGRPGSAFVLSADQHNSVNGIREFARAKGAAVTYVELDAPYGHDTFLIDRERVGGVLPHGVLTRLASSRSVAAHLGEPVGEPVTVDHLGQVTPPVSGAEPAVQADHGVAPGADALHLAHRHPCPLSPWRAADVGTCLHRTARVMSTVEGSM